MPKLLVLLFLLTSCKHLELQTAPNISPDLLQECQAKKPFDGTLYDELSEAFVERGQQLDDCGKSKKDLIKEINTLIYGGKLTKAK